MLNTLKKETYSHKTDIYSLWRRYQTSLTINDRNLLIIHYIWLVKYVLQSMSLPKNSILNDKDFLNIGILGLNESIERYQDNKGIKFETYAIPRIRGKIQDEMRKLDWISRTARKKVNDLIKVSDEFRRLNGREGTTAEIIKKLNIKPKEYKSFITAAISAKSPNISNHSNLNNSQDILDELHDITDHNEVDVLTNIENTERISFIGKYLESLTERKRLLMNLYYYENLTFKDIGKVIDVSESRVCQIHTHVISDLREKLKRYGHI